MGELGLFGLVFPERWGRADAGMTTLCLAIEEIGRVDQAIAFKCADMAVALETSRLATYEAARLYDAGRPYRRSAAIAKPAASEAAVTAARDATQVFGGYGFMDETPVSRFYRDAKILEIGEGTSEIQRLVISREYGLPV